MTASLWIGLVELDILPGCDLFSGRAAGAYVNALSVGVDPTAFQKSVRDALGPLRLHATGFEDVERFDERVQKRNLPAALLALAAEARASGKVCFSAFHTFPDDSGKPPGE